MTKRTLSINTILLILVCRTAVAESTQVPESIASPPQGPLPPASGSQKTATEARAVPPTRAPAQTLGASVLNARQCVLLKAIGPLGEGSEQWIHAAGRVIARTKTRIKIQLPRPEATGALSEAWTKCSDAFGENGVLAVRIVATNTDNADEFDQKDYFFNKDDAEAGAASEFISTLLANERDVRVRAWAFMLAPETATTQEISKRYDRIDPVFDNVYEIREYSVENAFGYRATFPVLWRPKQGTNNEKYAAGASAALLVYPARLFSPSNFWREIAIEGQFGAVAATFNPVSARSFTFLGAGVSYGGVVGLGYAYDLNNSKSFGMYFNLTLFSEGGMFGLSK